MFSFVATHRRIRLSLAIVLFGTTPLFSLAGTMALESKLDRDGHLDLPAGFSGTFVGGGYDLKSASGEAPRFVATQSNGWTAIGGLSEGCDGAIEAIARAPNGDVYVGGVFTVCGSIRANNIARWDGNRWWALGEGIDHDGSIKAIAIGADGVYVGGHFAHAGQVETANIARWTANEGWSELDGGLTRHNYPDPDGDVTALAISPNGDVYAGGTFNYANTGSTYVWRCSFICIRKIQCSNDFFGRVR